VVSQRLGHADQNITLSTLADVIADDRNRHLKKRRLFIVLGGDNTNRRIGLLERDSLS